MNYPRISLVGYQTEMNPCETCPARHGCVGEVSVRLASIERRDVWRPYNTAKLPTILKWGQSVYDGP